jgi:hypothetical protein
LESLVSDSPAGDGKSVTFFTVYRSFIAFLPLLLSAGTKYAKVFDVLPFCFFKNYGAVHVKIETLHGLASW